MKTELMVKNINFLDDILVAAQDKEGNVWAGVSYICNGIGLSKTQKDTQVEKIQKDLLLQQGCRKFPAGVFDTNNEAIALKLDFIPLWLAKISITPSMQENNPKLVDKLINYQLKAKDVLAAAFLPTYPTTYEYTLPPSAFESATNAGRLLERIMKMEGACPHEIAIVVKEIFRQANIDIPDCFIKIPAYEQLSFPEIITK